MSIKASSLSSVGYECVPDILSLPPPKGATATFWGYISRRARGILLVCYSAIRDSKIKTCNSKGFLRIAFNIVRYCLNPTKECDKDRS